MTGLGAMRCRLLTLAVFSSVALAGCSADDVELNGGIFNALGVSGNAQRSEPKLAARAPIVVPPTLDRLPEPGTAPEAAAMDVTASINDPDRKAQVSRAELERQQAEYCRKNYDMAKAMGDASADNAAGPLGPCRPSVLTAIKTWNQGEPAEE